MPCIDCALHYYGKGWVAKEVFPPFEGVSLPFYTGFISSSSSAKTQSLPFTVKRKVLAPIQGAKL